MATLLNVTGLTVAFSAFILLLMQAGFEYNFDRMHATSKRVYRVDTNREGYWGVIHSGGFIQTVMQSSPHIQAATIINPYMDKIYFSLLNDGEKNGFKETVTTCSPEIVKVFDFSILQGDVNCLEEPEKAIIPVSLAKKLFGDQPAVGKVLHAEEGIWTKSNTDLTIGAVYKDFPENTQLQNVVYTAMDANYDADNWDRVNFMCYLLLDSPQSKNKVEDSFNASFDYGKITWSSEEPGSLQMNLTPLADIYFMKDKQNQETIKSGNKNTSLTLILAAFMIVIIAAINFANFSTALAPMRIRNVNTQKVLGSTDSVLRCGFLLEAVVLSLFSFMLSLIVLFFLQQTSFLSFIDVDLRLSANKSVIIIAGIIAVLTGLIAGVYPAYYMTSYPPALVLKGNFGLSPKGKHLRTVLTGFQFVISISLIITSLFVRMQQQYMRNYSVGFDKDRIVVVSLNANMFANHRDSYVNKIRNFAGIDDVAFAREKLGAKDSYSFETFEYNGQKEQYSSLVVSYNFLSVMGIPIIEGREPGASDELGEKPLFLFNKMTRDHYDMQTGTQNLYAGGSRIEVLGFTENVKFTSLREKDRSIAFVINSKHNMPVSYIRLKAGTNYFAAVDHIRKSIAEIDPGFPVEIEFYDSIFDTVYRKEEKMNKIISLFGLLAIILSIVGVFGLVVFETQFRRRETGIRKVMGATVGQIITMFNKTYMRIVCISFILAAPIGYYAVSKWFENFAYRIPVYWWVFAIAFVIVAGVTLMTVSYRNWYAARANPVDSIKME
jgi:putative ABC transport system permease protein